jgi:Bifunctional DNA primase/polymerase, N-terminal/Primase C terminal 1 (PriCT-1)
MTTRRVRKFVDWQAEYARKKIATFPVLITAEGKKPLVSQYQHIGLPASAQIARKFADAPGIAFMAGPRNSITILDIDEPGDTPLQKALDRHGETPIIVRTASGKHHAWFRHNGERRAVRPEPSIEIDILGGGMVIAPPSHGPKGDYQFITGSLDDLDRLPVMRDVPAKALPLAPKPIQAKPRTRTAGFGRRNDALFRFCMRTAKRCNTLDQLLEQARQFNSQLLDPLQEDETVKTAASAWDYERRGENRFGQFGAWIKCEELAEFFRDRDHDALLLLTYLRANNGPWAEFMIADGLAKTFGWGRNRLSDARNRLLERGDVTLFRPKSQRTPALYQWA